MSSQSEPVAPASPLARDFVAEACQHVVADIGQINAAARRALDQAVRSGKLIKWSGHWFPEAGAPYGLGPMKTCWSSTNPWTGEVARNAAQEIA